MRQLTKFGKRVMATIGLVIASAVIITLGFGVIGGYARVLHLNQQAFNVIAILVIMPICCKVIVDMLCIINHGQLYDD